MTCIRNLEIDLNGLEILWSYFILRNLQCLLCSITFFARQLLLVGAFSQIIVLGDSQQLYSLFRFCLTLYEKSGHRLYFA